MLATAKTALAGTPVELAGADFIKTSTGKEPVNATLAVSLVMLRMIREYGELTGHRIGFKPAGGVGTAKDALLYLILLKEELGRDWLEPGLFRFGASSLVEKRHPQPRPGDVFHHRKPGGTPGGIYHPPATADR
jgi:deoxyribose-phosphate aldolase